MVSLFGNNKTFVLAANDSEAIFVDSQGKRGGKNSVQLLASQKREPGVAVNVGDLVSGTGRKKAKVVLVLPLSEFEIVSVSVPQVSREAISKMLPYSLAKVINKPVSDFIYDWQIAQSFKDSHDVSVFLYPAVRFEQYRQELLAHHKEIAWFEPDVFAACSYITALEKENADSTCLCLLVYQSSISIAIYENQRLSLLRSVEMVLPVSVPSEVASGNLEDPSITPDVSREQEELVLEETEELEEEIVFTDEFNSVSDDSPGLALEGEPESDDFLAGFGLQDMQERAGDEEGERQEKSSDFELEETALEVDRWEGYIDNLNLEIMRTGDYHTSALKGKLVQKVFLGASGDIYERLVQGVGKNQDFSVNRFPPQNIEAECSQVLAAVSIGAVWR